MTKSTVTKTKIRKNKIPFQKEYIAQLSKHMAAGHSFKSFAEKLNVSYSTMYRWTIDEPEFDKARRDGEKYQIHKKGWKL